MKSVVFPFYLILITFSFVINSCGVREQPISANEAKAYAKKIENSINAENATLLDNCFEESIMAKRIADNGDLKLNMRTMMLRRALNGIKLGKEIIVGLGKYGTYGFVKQYEKNKKQHLIFRLITSEGAFNYHDYELVKVNDKISVADVYFYLSGENMSKTAADMMMELDDSKAKDVEAVIEIKNLIQARNYESAKDVFDKLPAKMRKQKTMMLYRVMIYSGLDNDSLYQVALKKYSDAYPNQPNAYILSIDQYTLAGKYDEALDALNNLDKLIDKDPTLDYYRGLTYKLMNRPVEMKAALENVRKELPRFAPPLIELACYYAEEENITESVKALKQYQNALKPDPTEIEYFYQLYPEVEKAMKK